MRKGAVVFIALAIVWAAVILACAAVLRGTGYWDKLLPIVGGGAAAHIVILGGFLRRK
jgi:hypothetical protein